jgi:type I restriction enzyme S subunit
MKTVHLQQAEIALVLDILTKHIPDREVRIFGSRLGGPVKPFSDLDLVIMGNIPLEFSTLTNLREAFSESDIPFKVDIVDWATTNESFRKIIENKNVVLCHSPL